MKKKAPTLEAFREAKNKTLAAYSLEPLKYAIARSLTYERIGRGQINFSADIFKWQRADNPVLEQLDSLDEAERTKLIADNLREVLYHLTTQLYPREAIQLGLREAGRIKPLQW